jgi:iron complex outermembrane receptor protein
MVLRSNFLAQPIDNWQIKAGYAYVDSIVSASPSDTTVGNSVAFAPENDFYLWTRYNLNQTVGGWLTGFSLGINHESIRFTSANATSRVELPSYTKVDTGIYFEQDNYAIAFNIENLFDQRYFDGGTNDTKLYPGEPRKISLTLSSRF